MDRNQLRRDGLSALVLAWASDRTTGVARYITEVQRGLACNCVCPACGHPLEAVNPTKTTFGPREKRPFFRHYRGQERRNCRVLASRLALQRELAGAGVFNLPGRALQRTLPGASGVAYEGRAGRSPERCAVRHVHFRDDVLAVLVLADGRELEVHARGSVDPSGTSGAAAIAIDLTADEAAHLDPTELRARLFLRPESIVWLCHWADAELARAAEAAARAEAVEAMDEPADPAIPGEWMRESALHGAVKAIIAAELRMHLPPLRVCVARESWGLRATRDWSQPAKEVFFTSVALEQRLGRVIPDVVARAGEHELLIEVTVTHPVSDIKRERLAALGLPVLEIDLRNGCGRVTRSELRDLVLNDHCCKRWVFHPRAEKIHAELSATVAEDLQKLADARRHALQRQELSQPHVPAQTAVSTARVVRTPIAAEHHAPASGRNQARHVSRAPYASYAEPSPWLTGRELEEWKRRHPAAAADWEATEVRRGATPATPPDAPDGSAEWPRPDPD